MKIKESHKPLLRNPKEPVTYESLIDWLVKTGWVEGRVSKVMSLMDMRYLDDYIQECWYQILSVPHDKLLGVWGKGKGKFVNYIKSIIQNNVVSRQSHLYKNVRACRENDVFLDDERWKSLINKGSTYRTFTYPMKFDDLNIKKHDSKRIDIMFEEEPIKPDSSFSFEDGE